MKKIKILYVIGQLSTGGTELQLLELVRHLNQNRFVCKVVSLSERASLQQAFLDAGCQLEILHRETEGRFLTIQKLVQLMAAYRPDIIHAFDYASRAAIPAAKLAVVAKMVVSIRNNPNWIVKPIDKFINGYSDFILTNSAASSISTRKIWTNIPTRVIYNGLNFEKFDQKIDTLSVPVSSDNNSLGKPKVICVVSRLVPQKDLSTMLEAFRNMTERVAGWRLWIIGDGILCFELQQLAKKLGLNDQVVFWGERADVPAILRQSDIGVLSSKFEGLSNGIMEYMAASLPVVATDVGGNSELVIHNETGLIVPSGNPDALADAIFFLITHPEIAREFGCRGRERVQKMFDVTRMVEETEAVYQELVLK